MKAIVLTTVSFTTLLAAGCTDSGAGSQPLETAALSADEIAGLRFSREEEKLARDVYGVMEASGPIFQNIQASEQRHFDAIGGLLGTYGLEDPSAGLPAGAFANPDLAALYPELVQRGAAGGTNALGVGCTIEELDLRDLATLQATVVHSDLAVVYDSLALGSRNHLRAFYGNLVASGGSYTPIYIDQATFDSIVTSPKEHGGH